MGNAMPAETRGTDKLPIGDWLRQDDPSGPPAARAGDRDPPRSLLGSDPQP